MNSMPCWCGRYELQAQSALGSNKWVVQVNKWFDNGLKTEGMLSVRGLLCFKAMDFR
jgi:hypothetical protein